MNFVERERTRARGWKHTTVALPDAARLPSGYVNKEGTQLGPAYDFCLPREFADLTLLPEVREQALRLFSELQIPWHAGVGSAPSNHLLSSQVQCVNALVQMVENPDRLIRALGTAVGVGEVLQIEPGRFLTFEYIGPTDYFSEARGRLRVRGAHCTSVDAAFLHRHIDGATELVLLEWKYTESYRPAAVSDRKTAERRRRYEAAINDPAGPIEANVLPFELLTDEPLYQLVRQQLLAHELEIERVNGADRVRVVHISNSDNDAFRLSLSRAEHRVIGSTVAEVWSAVLRRPDRFLALDSSLFLDPEVTSSEYVQRYGDLVIESPTSLCKALDLATPADLEDRLYADDDFDGEVTVTDSHVEILIGNVATTLEYPFTVAELRSAATDAMR